jgi:hypothetical protein
MDDCLACGSSVIWPPFEKVLLRVPHPSGAWTHSTRVAPGKQLDESIGQILVSDDGEAAGPDTKVLRSGGQNGST